MKEITVSAVGWKVPDDFYVAFLAQVEAPSWHGHNLNALWDSITGGDLNRINPPFRLRIVGVSQTTAACRQLIERVAALIEEAKESGIPVELSANSNGNPASTP